MSDSLLKSLSIIESMLVDLSDEHHAALMDNPELQTAVHVAHKALFNARIKAARDSGLEKPLPSIRLTNQEAWFLRNLSTRKEGIPATLMRAQHDRLISEKLVLVVQGRCLITNEGLSLLSALNKKSPTKEIVRIPAV